MKELVEVIAKALVDHPEEVSVNEKQEGRTTVLELHVADGDMGKVIGKQGRIAKALRSVVKAAAAKEDKRVVVDIVERISAQKERGTVFRFGESAPFFFTLAGRRKMMSGRKETDGTVFAGGGDLLHTWDTGRSESVSDNG